MAIVSPAAAASQGQDRQSEPAPDQALVQVELTTVLAVPIVALLTRQGGTFAAVKDGRQVQVEVGLFDETAGLVEVTGVPEGANVEVPA